MDLCEMIKHEINYKKNYIDFQNDISHSEFDVFPFMNHPFFLDPFGFLKYEKAKKE